MGGIDRETRFIELVAEITADLRLACQFFEKRLVFAPKPQAAVVSITRAFDFPPLNGAVNPADGQLYLAGFQVMGWGTTATRLAGLGRVRATGLASTLPLALAGLACAGGADMVSGLFRMTIWNQTIPEQMRGRLAGIEMLSYSLGPLGGQIRAGVVADLWTVRGAIVSGGLACVGGVTLTALWLRAFWSYDARTDEHAVAERELRAARGEPAG